jgi:hypothetical protein
MFIAAILLFNDFKYVIWVLKLYESRKRLIMLDKTFNARRVYWKLKDFLYSRYHFNYFRDCGLW